ncbi:MAG: SEC-C metal-binding domain-containing protein [Syntrophobacteraceae bacterium]
MDKEILVATLKSVVLDFAQRNQRFALFMLIPSEPGFVEGNFTIIASANWLDTLPPKVATKRIIDTIIQKAGSPDSSAFRKIDRITVVKSNDPFVRNIISAFGVAEGADASLVNCNISGLQIDYAIILASNSDQVSVDQAKLDKVNKTQRNDPCPCGSGKKYKNCCGA